MSWNSNNGGPWKPQGQGPWGQPGNQNGQKPNDFEEAIRKFKEALRDLIPFGAGGGGGAGLGGRGVGVGILVAIIGWIAWASFYTVQTKEVALNLVLGRYVGANPAGLHANWPWPIGHVIKVPVWDQQITEVGTRSGVDISAETQMLTGDQNIVDVKFRISWQIDPLHPENYVFNVLNPRETVKAVAESVMREVVGLKTIDGIFTVDRAAVETDVLTRMQKVLDGYGVGAIIKQVQLQAVDAPAQVISAYRDVTAAQQDLQSEVNEAEKYAASKVPGAQGEASQIRAKANAYKEQTVAEAIGQTSRYEQVYAQYKLAPAVTRERIYIETMERALAGMAKTIVDADLRNSPLMLLGQDALSPKATGSAK